MPLGTNLKVSLLFWGSLFVTGITTLACSSTTDKYLGDKMVQATVINSWQAGTKKVIQVKTGDSYLIISDTYFGDLDPKIGDCVKIWVSDYTHWNFPHEDRNIASCTSN